MNSADAARILQTDANAQPEEVEHHFQELRARMEDKVAKAPTPGLKEKYRKNVEELIEARDTLLRAESGTHLPSLHRPHVQGAPSSAATSVPVSSATSSTPAASSRPKGSRTPELVAVFVIAAAVLGGGGWFVMKQREERAAQAKAAEERRLEQETAARLQAEAVEKRKEEEAEAARKREAFIASLRARLAGARTIYEELENEIRSSERRVSDLRGEMMSLRDAPASAVTRARHVAAQQYGVWLEERISASRVRAYLARAQELLSANAPEAAEAEITQVDEKLQALSKEIPLERTRRLAVTAGAMMAANLPGVRWKLVDAFGAEHTGNAPGPATEVALGDCTVTFSKPGFPDVVQKAVVKLEMDAEIAAVFPVARVEIESATPDTEVSINGRALGVAPLNIDALPPGPTTFEFRAPSFPIGWKHETVLEKKPAENKVMLEFPKGMPPLNFALGPKKYRVESHYTSVVHGTYGSTSTSQYSYEVRSDANWSTVTERVLLMRSSVSAHTPYLWRPGAELRFTRQADGKWRVNLLSGVQNNGGTETLQYTSEPGSMLPPMLQPEMWSTDFVAVGGTWTIPDGHAKLISLDMTNGLVARIEIVRKLETTKDYISHWTSQVTVDVRQNALLEVQSSYTMTHAGKEVSNGKVRTQVTPL